MQALGRHEDALAQLQALVADAGDLPELVLIQGQSLAALTRTEDAVKAYEAVIAADAGGPYATMAEAYLRVLTAGP